MKFKIFIIFNLISLIVSLRPNDLCNMVEEECRGKYDHNFNYYIKCEPKSCHSKYSHECGNKCAKDKTTCSQYEDFRIANQKNRVNLFTILKSFRKNFKEVGIAKLKNFDLNIPTCSKKQYEFKLNHICLSGIHCYEKINQYRGFRHHQIKRKMNCSCEGFYNYECNYSYCSMNKKSCDSFVNLLTSQNKSIQVLNKCENDYVIKIKQSFAFPSVIKI